MSYREFQRNKLSDDIDTARQNKDPELAEFYQKRLDAMPAESVWITDHHHGKAVRTLTGTRQWYARQMAAAQKILAEAEQVATNAKVALAKAQREIIGQ